jgi:SulP family sulfate permease
MAMAPASHGWLSRLLPFLQWTPMLNRSVVRADIIAGVVAGILILPQAIALATLAGLPPEIGLYTAIFPVLICALFGSSWHALSGPNTSISVVVALIVGAYATEATPDFVMYAITLTFMAGVIQVTFGFARLGVIFNYFSHSVMVALVTGVGIIIIVQQLGNFLGLTVSSGEAVEDTLYNLFFSLPRANVYTTIIGFSTVAGGILVKRYWPKIPYIIAAVVIGRLVAFIIDLVVGDGNTNVDKLGYLSLSALPLSAPDFSPTNFYEAAEGLVMGAFMVSFLGLMQSAVISRAIGVKSGQHVNIDQEMVGQGLSNLGGSFLSCYPSCGSFNRSASNFETGGKTPLTGIISAIVLALLIIFAAPMIAQMPLAIVGGVLILVGMGLIDVDYIKKTLRIRGETRIVFLLTIITTVYGGLQWAVMLGIFLSIVVYLRSVSRPELDIISNTEAHQYLPEGVTDEDSTVLHLSGSIFFGSTPTLERGFADVAAEDKHRGTLVIAGEYIDNLDEAGATALITEAVKRRNAGGSMHLWLRNHNFDHVIRNSGLLAAIGEENIHYVN